MPGDNLTHDEARQRSALIAVDAYNVSLDLRSALSADRPTFRSVTTLDFRCSRPGSGTFVDLIAASLEGVLLNGERLDPSAVYDGTRIALENLGSENRLVVTAQCAYGSSGEGLQRFEDPQDGEVYLYTQHEPAEARRVFAAFDQPDLKAPFTVSVTAPEHWTVLSNSHQAERDGGTWSFAPSRPLPCYLTAVVAGPYHQVHDHYRRTLADGSTLEIPLAVLCRGSLAAYLDSADLFLLTRQGLDFFHEHFDYPYPFGGYAQVFVPGFSMGAMENPGCVVLREEFLFRGGATQASYRTRANVMLHEMAHMWFGGLVTMEWWDDLWLKESFADFMATLSTVEATRFQDGWTAFANRQKSWAYRADQLPTTHPVMAQIPDLRSTRLNFDGITYAKGASVVRQLVAHVGRDAFFAAVRGYLREHAFGTARLSDLVAALERTSGRELGDWSRAWLATAGVNTLSPRVQYDSGDRIAELVVHQSADPAHPELRSHHIVVGLYRRSAGRGLERYARLEARVAGPRTVVTAAAGMARPDLVVVNDEDLGYCKIRFDEASLATLRECLGDLPDALTRALCWTALWNLTRDGQMAARDFLATVRRFAARETDIGVLTSLHTWAAHALTRYTAPRYEERERRLLAACALRELRASVQGSDRQLAWLCCFAAQASTPDELDLLRALLSGPVVGADQELRWTLLEALAAHDGVDQGDLAAELGRDDTASGRLRHARCLAARPSAEAKAAVWADGLRTTDCSKAVAVATASGFGRAEQRELLAPYAHTYFEVVEQMWADHPDSVGMVLVRGLFPAFQANRDTLRAADAWLSGHATAHPVPYRIVLECRDELVRDIHARSVDLRAR